MKIQIILILSFLCVQIGCKESNKNSESNKSDLNLETENNFVLKIGKPYFEYDEIEYYSTKIDEDKAMDLYENQENSSLEKLKYDIIISEFPETIKNAKFIKNLTKIGFSKSNIGSKEFEKINQIFVEKNVREALFSDCIALYRDILVFKKDNNVVGIVKVCFDCGQNRIVGTDANTENFGQDGDYKLLYQILKKN